MHAKQRAKIGLKRIRQVSEIISLCNRLWQVFGGNNAAMKTPNELKAAARAMYFKGYTAQEIARNCNVVPRTIYNWIKKEGWDVDRVDLTAQQIMAARINELASREHKTSREIKEFTDLCRVAIDSDIGAAKAVAAVPAESAFKNIPGCLVFRIHIVFPLLFAWSKDQHIEDPRPWGHRMQSG